MITIAHCRDLMEAQRLTMLLGCAHIESFIPDENSATLVPHYFFASGVRVQVADEDVERARGIVSAEKDLPAPE
jgi:putative signal transducing protein